MSNLLGDIQGAFLEGFDMPITKELQNGVAEAAGKGETAKEVAAIINEAAKKHAAKNEAAKPAPAVLESAKKEPGYRLADAKRLRTYIQNIAEMRPEEGKALGKIGEVMEKRAITVSEVKKIYESYGARYENFENLVRNGIVKEAEISESERLVRIGRYPKLTPERMERRKEMVVAMLEKRGGIPEEDIWEEVKTRNPETIKETLDIREKRPELDVGQTIFRIGNLRQRVELCDLNQVPLSEITAEQIALSFARFERVIKEKVEKEGREFKEL
jgi:hypothetical protein